MEHRIIRSSACRLVPVLLLGLTGCSYVGAEGSLDLGGDGGSPPRPTATKARVVSARIPGTRGRETYLAFQTRGNAVDAFHFARLPYDLWAPFRTEITYGVFDARRVEGVDDGILAFELDHRPFEPNRHFYGIYAHRIPQPNPGFNVFVASHMGNHGAQFFAGVERLDVVAEHDGTNLTFSARDAEVGGAFTTIATLNLPGLTKPLNLGYGASRLQRNAEVGFQRLRVPMNSGAPGPISAAHTATNELFEAALALLAAGYAMDGGYPDVPTATAALAQARMLYAQAQVTALALPIAEPELGRVDKQFEKLLKEIDKLIAQVARKGDRAASKVVKSVVKKGWKATLAITEAILPQELVDSLPPGGFPR